MVRKKPQDDDPNGVVKKRKVRIGGSKPKGDEFERHSAIQLSLWLTNGANSSLFKRNAMSGGSYTQARNRGVRIDESGLSGDIASLHPICHEFLSFFSVECKHYADLSLLAFLMDKRNKSFLNQTIRHTKHQAEESNKFWMVIAKQNRLDTLLLLPYEIGQLTQPAATLSKEIQHHSFFNETIWMMRFTEFLRFVRASTFISLVKNQHGHLRGRPGD